MRAVLVLLLSAAAASPTTTTTAATTATSSAASCRSCHVDVAAAHAASRHGTAATNPSFRASLATAFAVDRRWCVDCHAPRKNGDSGDDGVGCVSCHDPARHTAKVDVVVCARCHEVGLPPSLGAVGRSQDTPAEHARVVATRAAADRSTPSCVGCHLDGHRWPGGHDAAFAGRALQVQTAVEGDDVVVTLIVDGIGHPLPTGDPFRVLAVRACSDRDCERVLARRSLGRRLVPRDRAEWGVVDTRPWPGQPAQVRLSRADGVAFVEVALESLELFEPAEARTILHTVAVPPAPP